MFSSTGICTLHHLIESKMKNKKEIGFDDATEEQLAEQLTWIEFSLFQHLYPSELLVWIANDRKDIHTTPHLNDLICNFNRVSESSLSPYLIYF